MRERMQGGFRQIVHNIINIIYNITILCTTIDYRIDDSIINGNTYIIDFRYPYDFLMRVLRNDNIKMYTYALFI